MIDKRTGLWIYNKMNEIRDFEETAWTLFTENKLRGSVHLYTGEEAVAAAEHLPPLLIGTLRGRTISWEDIRDMILEFFYGVGDLVHRTTPSRVPPARRMILLIVAGTLPLFAVLPVMDQVEGLGQLVGHQAADLVEHLRVGPVSGGDLDAVAVGQGLDLGINVSNPPIGHLDEPPADVQAAGAPEGAGFIQGDVAGAAAHVQVGHRNAALLGQGVRPGPPGGAQGDARPAQPVNVPLDGAHADLEPVRQAPGGDLPLPEQHRQDADLDQIYDKFGIDYNLLALLMYRGMDEDGNFQIRWGEQMIG